MEKHSIWWNKISFNWSLSVVHESSPNRSLTRITAILNCFTEKQPVLSLTDISGRIDLPMSTTHRLLKAMETEGLIQRANGGKDYQLGFQLIRWGMLAQTTLDLRRTALPILQELAEKTGETSVLSVPDGKSVTWVEMVESRHNVRWASKVGRQVDLHAGASSKVLWAFKPEQERESLLLELPLTPKQPNTITDKKQMETELAEIYERGFAISYEETDEGAMGIAAPVFNHNGELVAGIGIIAPVSRIPPEEVSQFSEPVIKASQELSKHLGFRDSK